MPDILEISLLGGVAVRRHGGPLAAFSSRAIGLLTYLVLHADTPQSRSHLAGTFWPDSTEAQARTNLRRELHLLRALLVDHTCLLADSTSLGWLDTAECQVDVRRFLLARRAALDAEAHGDSEGLARHSSAAVGEYHGPLLLGWYDDWVVDARDELHRQCIDLCDRAVRASGASRDPARVLEIARLRVQWAPMEESGYQQLMALQAASGDRAGAMTTYHRCASILEQELGVGPSPATSKAIESIMGAATDARPRHGDTLVGRAVELETLQDCWDRAVAGRPGIALVSGESGVGKSYLVSELSRLLSTQGVVLASARCFGTSGRLALAPVADWLRSPPLRTGRTRLDKVWRDEVERLMPGTSRAGEPAPSSGARIEPWERLRFFEGLARAVLVAGRPTVLVLDDLQWCDNDTMLWLTFLLGLSVDAPLLVVCTVRGDELVDNPGVLSSLRSLRSAGLVTEISLSPLEPADTAHVAAQLLGHRLADADVALLQSATGGYPLYIVEAIRNLPAGPPGAALGGADFEGVLQQRLSSASVAAQQVAGLAGAVGRDFSLDLLSEASDLDGNAVVGAVDELWRRRIIQQSGQGYDFAHDLLRDTAYASVPPAQQWLLHHRIAQSIELLHPGRLDEVAAQLAHHYERSGRPDRALPFYLRAAEVAASVYASAEAIRLLRLALALLRRQPAGRDRDLREIDVLQAIAPPLNALHGYAAPELDAVLTRLVDLADTQRETRVHLASMVGLWGARFVQGNNAGAFQLAAQALALSEQIPELSGQANLAYAGSVLTIGQPAVSLDHFELARDRAAGEAQMILGTRPEVHAQAWSAHARWLVGDAEGAAADCDESLRRAREAHHPYSLAVALAYAALSHQMNGELPAMDDAVRELTRQCDQYSIAYYPEWARVLSGWRVGGAPGIAMIRAGLANLTASHSLTRMPLWLSLLADAHRADGDGEAARAALDAARVAAVQHDDRWWLPEVLRQSAAWQPPEQASHTLAKAAVMAAEPREPHAVASLRGRPGPASRSRAALRRSRGWSVVRTLAERSPS